MRGGWLWTDEPPDPTSLRGLPPYRLHRFGGGCHGRDDYRGGTLPEPFVGIKVIIHYTDGTSEMKYLAVPDMTTQ